VHRGKVAVVQRSLLSVVVFLAVLSLVVGGIHYYLWVRLVRAPALSPTWQRSGGVVLLALALLTPLAIGVASALPRRAATWVAGAAYAWMGVAVLLFFLLLAGEALRAVVLGAAAALGQPLDPERRTFLARLIAGSAAALGAVFGGLGAVNALTEIARTHVRIPLRRLPPALSGFRIVQLTDIHIGPTIGGDWLRGVVDQVNALEPDLIAITGDLVDGSVETLRDHVAPLGALRAKHGVFFVTGNHEYYSDANAWIAELDRLGVRVLRNERVAIGDGDASFDLAGVDDMSGGRYLDDHGPDLDAALAGRDPNRELVLLAHQPKQIIKAAAHGVGLQLSGHTHGGQFFPWHFFVGLDQPYLAGLHRHGDAHVYVSRGTGYWGPPMRLAAPAEIAVVELHAA